MSCMLLQAPDFHYGIPLSKRVQDMDRKGVLKRMKIALYEFLSPHVPIGSSLSTSINSRPSVMG